MMNGCSLSCDEIRERITQGQIKSLRWPHQLAENTHCNYSLHWGGGGILLLLHDKQGYAQQ